MWRLIAAVSTALLIGLTAVAPARAEGAPQTGTLSFIVENDVFYNIDRHYTNGVRLVWVPAEETEPPEWAVTWARLVPWFPRQGTVRSGFALGQSMFTPRDITVSDPPRGERPYAGWLYGTVGLGVESGRQLDQLGITFGMVGPASLAEESQKFVHKVIDSDRPKGWDTQLRNEPGVVFSYQRSWRALVTKTYLKNDLDFSPHVGGAVGNVFTYANAGITMRYGQRLPNDYGPPRIQPGLPGTSDFSPLTHFGWYLFAGIDGRVVAHNIFLDGNTFKDSRSVDKYPLVGDLQIGLVLDWPAIRFSYTHVLRTREFQTQDDVDDFGALSLSAKF
jgi:hypothetical protein